MKRMNTAAVSVAVLLCGASATARADVVQDWNATTIQTLDAFNVNPFFQARWSAMVQVAVFEAVNAINGEYQPYYGTISAPPGASAEAAAIQAAYRTTRSIVASNPTLVDSLDAFYATSIAAIPDGPAKDDGIAVGEAAAAEVLADRANDGSQTPATYIPPPNTAPGEYQLTPGCAASVLVHWANLRPFGVESTDQFRSAHPPHLHTGRYANDYNEVKKVGQDTSAHRPADRTLVAQFFARTGASYAWNQAASQVMTQRGTTLSQNARIFALLNMSVSDGLAHAMETKYHYKFWRPVTAIRNGDLDDNKKTAPDPSWSPFISTPCFPSYPSAHASASYAARKIAEELLGGGNHNIVLTRPDNPSITLSYSKFSQMTDDIDDARVYGGIHFRFDQQAGATQGRAVALYVCQNNLLPLNGEDTCRD